MLFAKTCIWLSRIGSDNYFGTDLWKFMDRYTIHNTTIQHIPTTILFAFFTMRMSKVLRNSQIHNDNSRPYKMRLTMKHFINLLKSMIWQHWKSLYFNFSSSLSVPSLTPFHSLRWLVDSRFFVVILLFVTSCSCSLHSTQKKQYSQIVKFMATQIFVIFTNCVFYLLFLRLLRVCEV